MNLNRHHTFLLGIVILFASAGCNYRVDKSTPTSPKRVADAQLAYADIRATIIVPYCIKCHSGASPAGEVNLENYESLKENLEDAHNDIMSGRMPLKSSMPREDKDFFDAWFKAGAPGPAPAPTPTELPGFAAPEFH